MFWFTQKTIISVFVCVCVILSTSSISHNAFAELSPQSVVGIVDTANEILQDWKPLDETVTLLPGNLVRTDFEAGTDLLGNDGSLFNLGEVTEFLILGYNYQPDNEIRIVQCVILEGQVMVEAAHLDYSTNIFDIETPTVTASFKFSKAFFVVEKNGKTVVKLINGKFELVGLEGIEDPTRTTHVIYVAKDATEIEITLSAGRAISAETTDAGLKIDNAGNSPISVSVGGQPVELTPGASIETSPGEDGKPVIQNTSQNSQADVTIGGVKIDAGGSLSLTLGGSQTAPETSSIASTASTDSDSPASTDSDSTASTDPDSAASTEPDSAASTTPAVTSATTTFQSINQGSTSSSVPSSAPSSAGSAESGETVPGGRPPERRPVMLPIKVSGK